MQRKKNIKGRGTSQWKGWVLFVWKNIIKKIRTGTGVEDLDYDLHKFLYKNSSSDWSMDSINFNYSSNHSSLFILGSSASNLNLIELTPESFSHSLYKLYFFGLNLKERASLFSVDLDHQFSSTYTNNNRIHEINGS